MVIIADYDHGLLTPKVVDLLTSKSGFLAVNTQINAANRGFHAISKYSYADYVCIQEGEIRLDRRSQKGDLNDLICDLANRMEYSSIMVTRGSNGSLFYHKGEGFTACPAFAVNVVDRMGAGDAVLALTSVMSANNVPSDVICFVGNLVGADAVSIVGNRRSIDHVNLMKSIESLLK